MMGRLVVALSGGVGGAKLASGLAAILPPDQLVIAANVGDDFDHLGLRICPDLDSNLYALAELHDEERGWGRRDESWSFMKALSELGGPDWFAIGDRDLALHVLRTQWLKLGASLTEITRQLAAACKVKHKLVPVTSDPVRTTIVTADGELSFQDYFVARQCVPVALGVRFHGGEQARLDPALDAALDSPDLHAIILCPSNPFLSIDPILAVGQLRTRLTQTSAPIIAVSPIVGGEAVKGPLAKLMLEFGLPVSPAAVAAHYGALLDGMLVDYRDEASLPELRAHGVAPAIADTLMTDGASRAEVARAALLLGDTLAARKVRLLGAAS